MNEYLFGVFDEQAECMVNLFFAKSNGLAIRSFTDVARAKDTNIANHPEDFKLMRLGSVNNETGAVHSEAQPVLLVTALEVRADPVTDQTPSLRVAGITEANDS